MMQTLLAVGGRRGGAPFSRLAILGRARRASNHFLDNLLSVASRIVPVLLLWLLPWLVDHDDVGHRAIGVLLGPAPLDQMPARGTGRHDALTQLATKHEASRWRYLRGWLKSRQG